MSNPPFQMIIGRARDDCTVYLSGEIDLAASLELAPELDEVTECCGSELLLDLGAVTLIDSEGIKALIRVANRMQRKSGRARIVRCSKFALRVLQLTGVDTLLDIEHEPMSIA